MPIKNTKRILRLKFDDIAYSEDELNDSLYFLESVYKNIPFNVDIHLWYISKNTSNKKIEKFKENNLELISKLNIKILELNGYETFAWYDIIPKEDENILKKFKFRLTYNTLDELLSNLIEFNNFVKSYNVGYSNAKYSNNRVFKLAR